MVRRITRRAFIRRSAAIGAASVMGGPLLHGLCESSQEQVQAEPAELAVVKGEKNFEMAVKAVELLGGMKKYVPKDARVCILPNSQRDNPGTYTDPEIVRAVIRMCKNAGAKEVNCLSWLPKKVWDSSGLGKVVEEEGAALRIVDMKDESLFKPVPVPKGKALKEARIMKVFYENDVFINMPIAKDHAGNRFTGTLKNLMGLNSPKTNRTFHTGNFKNDDIGHLDQCIADLNTVIRPALCIVDATKFIITNGPFGPGQLHTPRKVVAGTDRVAIDAYCASLWGLKPGEILMIQKAHEHELGDADFTKKRIREVEI